MMRDMEGKNKDKKNNTEFQTKRAIIGDFFESYQLRRAVSEFFVVQNKFHTQMNVMVEAFTSIMQDLPVEKRYLLNELLQPYRQIINNPFQERSSGDLINDITHILNIVSSQNKLFSDTLRSSLNSASNLPDFHHLLTDFRQNENYVKWLKEKMQSNSWLEVQSRIDAPFQNIMRYELLMKNIKNELVKKDCPQLQSVLDGIMDKIAALAPELKYLNDNREILAILNQAQRIMSDLLEKALPEHQSLKQEQDNSLDLKKCIEEVLRYICDSKCAIAIGESENLDLLKGLSHLLNEVTIQQKIAADTAWKNTSTVSVISQYAYSTASSTFRAMSDIAFGSVAVETSEEKLTKLIVELNDMLLQAEILFDLKHRIKNK